ncbi:MAG: protein translocase subunit SecD [Calditrichaeota bacterium]|nr:protein translocase subunit SecD [Calditrichota bacterium]MCB9475127.1 protein translocase subunit SecD [Candidatus Delongbacteria bacterium]
MEHRHNNRLRWILLAVFILLAGWKLYPTIQLARYTPEELHAMDPKEAVELRSKSIKQGLDLQGGMHMVLEVDLVSLVDNLARNKDSRFETRLRELDAELSDLSDFWSLFADKFSDLPLSEYFNRGAEGRRSNEDVLAELETQSKDAIDNSLTILRNRVDGTGLQEPSITKQGQRRIVVELAGVNDPEAARRMIGKTALLEFKLVEDVVKTNTVLEDINNLLKNKQAKLETAASDSLVADAADSTAELAATTETVASSDTTELDPLSNDALSGLDAATPDSAEPFYSLLTVIQGRSGVMVSEQNRDRVLQILARDDVKQVIPSTSQMLLGKMEPMGEENFGELFLVRRQADLTGAVLEDAGVNIDQGYSSGKAGSAIVQLSMNKEGSRTFARITEAYKDRRLAIVLDDRVFMAPVIRNRIPNGQAIIEGMSSIEEARELANLLKHGALPSTVKVVEERTVGASLGVDSIRAGKNSAIFGFLIVAIFMVIYYNKPGGYSVVALVLNIVFILAILAAFGATLTLPGIAGIILTMGMAVDANVLIFERIREEVRAGRSIRAAIDAGFDRAFTTIVDANLTTLIAGVVLYQFGSGPIRGFALTLMIGIVSSMYTAIIVTHLLFERFTDFEAKKLSI